MTNNLQGRTSSHRLGGSSGADWRFAKKVPRPRVEQVHLGWTIGTKRLAKGGGRSRRVMFICMSRISPMRADVKGAGGNASRDRPSVSTAAELAFKPFLQLEDADIHRTFRLQILGVGLSCAGNVAPPSVKDCLHYIRRWVRQPTRGNTRRQRRWPLSTPLLDGSGRGPLHWNSLPCALNVVSPGIFDSTDLGISSMPAAAVRPLTASAPRCPSVRVGNIGGSRQPPFCSFIHNGLATEQCPSESMAAAKRLDRSGP